MSSADAHVAVGQLLAERYRVERVLGHGGMGTVVAAADAETGVTVAVKVLRPRADSSTSVADQVARFAREAAAARKLRSEHVAQVLDAGTTPSGAPFLVMEYLEGCDLWSHLKKRGVLPVGAAVDLILQASDAIAEAHAFGIVHRDLKPANLFLSMRQDGSALVKVLDFGISKSMPTEDTMSSTELALTGTLTVVGSPHYMAPEQMLSSRSVDERADIYSLGVNLYLFVSGVHPFDGTTLPELCAKVLKDPPRPLWEVAPGTLPEGFEAVVMRCLEKNPDDRYPTVVDLIRALAPYAGDHPTDLTEIITLPEGEPVEELADDEGSGPRLLAAGSSADMPLSELLPKPRESTPPPVPAPPPEPPTRTRLMTYRQRLVAGWRDPKIIAVAAGILGGIVIAIILVTSRGRAEDAPAPPPREAPSAAPTPTPSPTPSPSPEPASASAPAPAPDPSPPPVAHRKRPTAPPASRPPRPPSEEDLLRERKRR